MEGKFNMENTNDKRIAAVIDTSEPSTERLFLTAYSDTLNGLERMLLIIQEDSAHSLNPEYIAGAVRMIRNIAQIMTNLVSKQKNQKKYEKHIQEYTERLEKLSQDVYHACRINKKGELELDI